LKIAPTIGLVAVAIEDKTTSELNGAILLHFGVSLANGGCKIDIRNYDRHWQNT
jgi:hypothetical protein